MVRPRGSRVLLWLALESLFMYICVKPGAVRGRSSWFLPWFFVIIVSLINIQSTFMYIHSNQESVLSLYDFLLIYVMAFSIKRVRSFCWVLLCYPRRRRTPTTFWLSCRIGFKDVSITSHLGIFRKTTYGFQISLDVKYYRLEPYSSHAPIPTIPSVLLKK